ncbi:MAG: type 4a pilus biogenesis protein PilO [Negativicutes bacterium]|jgi:Tfp pilus assembly protein PilO
MPTKFSFSELSDKLKIVIFVGVVAAFIFLLYTFLYVPAINHAADLDKQYETLLQEVKELDDFLKAHPDLDAYLLETDRTMRVFNTLLPNDNNVSNYIVIANKIAQAAGVNMTSIAPAQWVDKDKFQEMTMTINVNGSYINLMRYFKLMEDNPMRFTSIRSVNISADKTENGAGDLNAVMTVAVFSWKEKNLENRYLKVNGR